MPKPSKKGLGLTAAEVEAFKPELERIYTELGESLIADVYGDFTVERTRAERLHKKLAAALGIFHA